MAIMLTWFTMSEGRGTLLLSPESNTPTCSSSAHTLALVGRMIYQRRNHVQGMTLALQGTLYRCRKALHIRGLPRGAQHSSCKGRETLLQLQRIRIPCWRSTQDPMWYLII